jgi:hypothetical protein
VDRCGDYENADPSSTNSTGRRGSRMPFRATRTTKPRAATPGMGPPTIRAPDETLGVLAGGSSGCLACSAAGPLSGSTVSDEPSALGSLHPETRHATPQRAASPPLVPDRLERIALASLGLTDARGTADRILSLFGNTDRCDIGAGHTHVGRPLELRDPTDWVCSRDIAEESSQFPRIPDLPVLNNPSSRR